MSALWRRQIAGILRIELGKSLLSRRAIPMYLFAGLPVMLGLLQLVAMTVWPDNGPERVADLAMIFVIVYQFILRGLIFMGCVWIFMNLFRGEILDRSLHYYFLAPVRREVLVAGKFLSGWISAAVLFGCSTFLSMAIPFGHFGSAGVEYMLRGEGFAQWTTYVCITILACLGYGAVFLLIGLFFRNPLIPALLIFGWEQINPMLPALLKKFSVIFYLHSFLPLQPEEGPLALIADPVSAWIAVPGLIVFSLTVLVVAGLKARHMEIAYGQD